MLSKELPVPTASAFGVGRPASEPLTILVTGATGRVGRHLVRHLIEDGHHVRALTRQPDTADLPAGVVLYPGDPTQPDAVAAAAHGAHAAFLNWMGFDASGASDSVQALASNVEHIVYLSAAQLQGEANGVMPGVWADLEGAITESGTDSTFLRAGAFAANAFAWAENIRDGEPVQMPHPDAQRSPVHEADVAEAAWRCLVEQVHRGNHYEITGPETLSLRRQAELIGEVVGNPVTVRQQDTGRALAQMSAWAGRDFAQAAFDYWATLAVDPERTSVDFEQITNHPARPFHRWAGDHLDVFRTPINAKKARRESGGTK